eukprot:CAMPEP_0201688340 /NCGR_PEP_ID=MMETSP0578-20130828/2102_1 /ASSEMBLY_ACC=CAM_ASM_000663 /TAXON_ID=267565 /ORGANISM="Skeletonema grethea, Strain CCMP 1804" /LENGTH=53 /DNA_ID=CAMNT_0048172617 /DNA_START=233 /DNA_END=391 /DNA_ORIENTATION=-
MDGTCNIGRITLIDASFFSAAFDASVPTVWILPDLQEVYLRVRPQGGRAPFIV